jgi:hypothetical protein
MYSFISWWTNPPDRPYVAYNKAGKPGAHADLVRKRAQTRLTVNSSRYQVGVWLKYNEYLEYIPTMTRYTGLQLLYMSVAEDEALKASLNGTLKHLMFHSIERCRERAGITSKNIYGHTCVIHL